MLADISLIKPIKNPDPKRSLKRNKPQHDPKRVNPRQRNRKPENHPKDREDSAGLFNGYV